MSDVLSEFAIHVGTGVNLGPDDEAGRWHRGEADWREREIRDFIWAMAAALRAVRPSVTDPENQALIDALLTAHPALTDEQQLSEPEHG